MIHDVKLDFNTTFNDNQNQCHQNKKNLNKVHYSFFHIIIRVCRTIFQINKKIFTVVGMNKKHNIYLVSCIKTLISGKNNFLKYV